MLDPATFIEFQKNLERHLEQDVTRRQKHKQLVEEIQSRMHRVELEGSNSLNDLQEIEKCAVEVDTVCVNGSQASQLLLRSSIQWIQAYHHSLLRRTVAINLELELKQQLWPNRPHGSLRSQSIWQSLKEARSTNAEHARSITRKWFLNRSDKHQFCYATQLLKSVSSRVHPVNTIDGTPMTVSTTLDLLQEDFLPDQSSPSSDRGHQWDSPKKKLISDLVYMLEDARIKNGRKHLLLS
ncbi:hypothetical protein MJO28_000659 [Puccinia striiformis f. sp. tritici]|uniref:Uncharacterized protein n=2 Tax=Puccinia striiformis TaxID=27350 RepID=A0A2S4V385_9BASI|nr:hypothetical protein MJO28_000659 [Puccinia striiformis f. sp. tritici]POW03992.1 hypothetical protein PSTT_10683 [Puccinia striiformis]